MSYSHFNREISLDIEHLPEIEAALRGIHADLQEIGISIAQQKNTAIKNTILSTIIAVTGIIGAYQTCNKDNKGMFHATSIVGLIGLLGTLHDGRRIINPGDFDTKIRLLILQEEQRRLLSLSSEIRNENITS